MRITLDLPSDVYALAKSVSKDEDCTLGAAVNLLLRRSVKVGKGRKLSAAKKPRVRNGFVISRGAVPVTLEMVKQMETEADAA